MSMGGGHVHIPPPDHVDSRGLQEAAKHDHRAHFGQRGHRRHATAWFWRALTWPIRRALRAWLD